MRSIMTFRGEKHLPSWRPRCVGCSAPATVEVLFKFKSYAVIEKYCDECLSRARR